MDSLRCGWPGWPAGSWRSLDGQVLLCDGPRSDLGPHRRLRFLVPLAGRPQPPPSRGHPPSESRPQTLVEPVPSLPEPGSLRVPALQCPVSCSPVLRRHRMWPVSRLRAVLRGERLRPFFPTRPSRIPWQRARRELLVRRGLRETLLRDGPPHEHHPWLPTSTGRPPWPPLAALHCWVMSSAPVRASGGLDARLHLCTPS